MVPFQNVILMLLIVACGGCTGSTESPLVVMERARILMDRGKQDEAVPLLTQVIDALPEEAQARYLRGVAYESLNVLERALTDYEGCLQIDPQRRDARNNKAVVLARMQRFEDAATEFSELLQSDPQDALAYRNRALCRFDQELFEQALADYNTAIELAPQDPSGWFQRGNVYLEQDRFAEAEADFSKAIALDAEFAKAWMNRGVARYHAGRKTQAAEDLQTARSLDDNIILPGIDFFAEVPAATTSHQPVEESWSAIRDVAVSELTSRGFTEITAVHQYPGFRCAEFSARMRDQPRRILVTCVDAEQNELLLPAFSFSTSGTPAAVDQDNAAAVLILQIDDAADGTITVRQFQEAWNPDPASVSPVIIRTKL